jgi:hypothetical protein
MDGGRYQRNGVLESGVVVSLDEGAASGMEVAVEERRRTVKVLQRSGG